MTTLDSRHEFGALIAFEIVLSLARIYLLTVSLRQGRGKL